MARDNPKWIPLEDIFECQIEIPKWERVCPRDSRLQGKCGRDDNYKLLGCPHAIKYFKQMFADHTSGHGVIKLAVSKNGNGMKGTKIVDSEISQVIIIEKGERSGV